MDIIGRMLEELPHRVDFVRVLERSVMVANDNV